MSSMFGKNIKISIAGQSHSAALGVTIDGLPPGFKIDTEELSEFLSRRAPGKNQFSTARKEADLPVFLSGVVDNTTCGAPLLAIIRNTNTRSSDYDNLRDIPRPSHADYATNVKYNGFQDVSGGGHFSGRLTAPLCVAGGICLQILKSKGIEVYAHIKEIHGKKAQSVDYLNIDTEILEGVKKKDFPVLDDLAGEKMKQEIEEARKNGDSVGGIIECAVLGVPAGIGEPMFDRLENKISSAIFGIPAVRGLEFGNGFESALLYGSENNDPFYIDENGDVKTRTNNSGGILGGISSGMPIVFRAAIKPTPSISKKQESVSLSKKENTILEIKGRHDPCIVQRAVPVIEAAAAIAILDCYIDSVKYL